MSMLKLRLRSLCAAALLSAACSGSGLESPDAGADFAIQHDLSLPPDFSLPSRDPTAHPPSLQMTNHGGSVLAAMELYTIVWQGDEPLGADVDAFHQAMLTSSYWTSRLGEYGVGVGSARGVLVIPSPPPSAIDDTQLAQMIVQNVASGTWPPAGPNTVYAYIVSP